MSDVVWLRRDLRRSDLPTVAAAAAASSSVAVLFVLDPTFFDPAGPVRQAWLARTLLALRDSWQGRLVLRRGSALEVVPAFAREVEAAAVHVSTETEPAGSQRDADVRAALAEVGVGWVETGSPYAVTPGRVQKQDGTPFRVFTPFSRAWRAHGWPAPASAPPELEIVDAPGDDQAWDLLARAASEPGLPTMPEAGEPAAHARWQEFLDERLDGYAAARNRPDVDATSFMSPYLKFGVVHPRTLLADLAARPGRGADTFVSELAWREFYADVLHHQPASLTRDVRPELAGLDYDDDPRAFAAWTRGQTGYPIVDAGMRQLLATGWMHNRVRMITASFFTKDLHLWWGRGAGWFEERLIDADLASNRHGWQWVAGTGTDAAPYFRVFNPTLQAHKFDPHGDYVRTWIPELRHLAGAAVHEPWKVLDGYARGYPEPIVDHDVERRVALTRYESARLTRRSEGYE